MAVRSAQLQIRLTPAQKARLARLARRAGTGMSEYVLSRALPAAGRRFAGALDALRSEGERRFALGELNDFLSGLARFEFDEAVAEANLRDLSALDRNYVAAMVEHAAARLGARPPAWTRSVEPLAEPYFATPLRSLREHLLRASPVPFKRRNLFVDASVGDRV